VKVVKTISSTAATAEVWHVKVWPVTYVATVSQTNREKFFLYREIMTGWNYDTSGMHMSFPVSDFRNFKCLIFVAQSAHGVACIEN
jgi:hypothetical protein